MTKESVSILSVLVNIFLGISKVAIGFLINSSALVADGVHSTIDFISSLGVYIGIKVAKKPVDKEHPYGYYAAETISGLLVVFLLIISAIWIVYDGLNSILNKEIVQLSIVGFIIVIVSIILVESMARLKFKYGQKEESLALIADAQHSRADVFSSIGVLVSLFLVRYFIYADGMIAILIGIYILKQSFNLGKEVVDNLLGVRDEKTEETIRKYCREKNIELSSLKTQKIGSATLAELAIKLDSRLKIEEAEAISKKIQSDLAEDIKNLKYVVVQVESHKTRQGFIRSRWGKGMAFRQKFVLFGPEKRGYRIIIPFRNGNFNPYFGAPEYLVIDKKEGKIIERQIVKNPYFQEGEGTGGGMRFLKSLDPDEVVVQTIGNGAKERLKELGIKLTIIKNEQELKEILS
jgi:cation diffusion facilitator family transporter